MWNLDEYCKLILILSDFVHCCENFLPLGWCFDLCVDKFKRAFFIGWKVSRDQLALSLNLAIFRTV